MKKWLVLSLAVIVLDQFTKQLAENSLQLHETVGVLPFLNITLAYNTGAAFSFLSDASGWQRWFFTVLALCVSIFLVVWMHRLESGQRHTAIALALILGGALGNVWDRIMLGYVIDFIDVFYSQWHWPAFNVADSAITIGAAILIVDALTGGRGNISDETSGN